MQAVPGLRFIGEGFRYFEFAIVPLAVLISTVGADPMARPVMVGVAVAAGLAGAAQMRRTVNGSRLVGTSRDERAVTLARRLRTNVVDRLLVMPLQYAPLLTVEADKAVLMMLDEVAADRSEDFYPVMERSPLSLAEEFAVQGVWLDRRYVGPEELRLGALDLLDEEGPFACYRRRSGPAA